LAKDQRDSRGKARSPAATPTTTSLYICGNIWGVPRVGTAHPLSSQIETGRRIEAFLNGVAPWPASEETFALLPLLQPLGDVGDYRFTATMNRFYGAKRRDVHLERRLGEEMDRSSQMAHHLALSQTSPS